ncbi:hypothetical protein Tco_0807312 [Tanacetum coccineum]
MVAYLEKTNGNAEFHEDHITSSHASSYSLCSHFAGKPVSISEASIRSDLQFNDAAGNLILHGAEVCHDEGNSVKDSEGNKNMNTTERVNLTLKPLPKIDLKSKARKILEEKAESDADQSQKGSGGMGSRRREEELVEEEATKAAFTNEYDFIQARLNADKILAEKLQEEEREKFTIEQRAKFLHDTMVGSKKISCSIKI